MNMRGPPGVGMIAPRIGAGFHGDEFVATLGVGQRAAGAGEIRIERRRMLVAMMDITAGGVRLPDFHEGARYRTAVFVEHASRDDNPLALRLALVLAGKVGIVGHDFIVPIDRSRHFRKRLRHENERLPRRALYRRYIRRVEARWLVALFLAAVGNRIGQSSLPLLRAKQTAANFCII